MSKQWADHKDGCDCTFCYAKGEAFEAGAKQERERIVAWLREMRPDAYTLLDDAADAIEKGAK